MSFLYSGNSQNISARLTQKGRSKIAKGDFNITHFMIGDSEYSYSNSISDQKVLSPLDKDVHIKYPIPYTTGTTSYGTPTVESDKIVISNVMGPAGCVTGYKTNQTQIKCQNELISFSQFNGSNQITVTSGASYSGCQYITVALYGTKINNSTDYITGKTNSLVYKITGITGNILYLDRSLGYLSSLAGNTYINCNKCEQQNPVNVDTTTQQNSWTLNVIWDKKPIGFSTSHRQLSGYTSSKYLSTKEFFGYKSSSGQTNNTGTTIVNSYNDLITILPEEQKCIALLHYSELSDSVINPNRFLTYDDYISVTTGATTSPNIITDEEYFEIHIPYLLYHRNTGSTLGATFHLGSVDKTITSSKNGLFIIDYRDLLDENNNRVGKVFYKHKVIIFDDEEIVTVLEYKSNRKYTLPAPKVGSLDSVDPIIGFTSGKTLWVTYMLSNTNDNNLNGFPCNYFQKITGGTAASIRFKTGEFGDLKSTVENIVSGYYVNKFYVLAQLTNVNEQPSSDSWKLMDYTTTAGGSSLSGLTNTNFMINNTNYTGGTTFSISNFMSGTSYNSTTSSYFGDEQPFPGSIKVVRSTDIEQMVFNVNLPTGKFITSQNPSYTGGTVNITDVALLNSNKETLVISKSSVPIVRSGSQIIKIRLDF